MLSCAGSRVWFITGASSGLGLALTHRILIRGERVIAAVRSPSKMLPLVPDQYHTSLHVMQLDVTEDPDPIQEKIQNAMKVWGGVDVLVNNAGTGRLSLCEEGKAYEMQQCLKTNLFGAINVSNAILPHMRERKAGTVIMVGSRSAWRNEVLGFGAYGASKAALHSYTETLSAELRFFSVRVLLVIPGSFRTPGIYPSQIDGTYLPAYDALRSKLQQKLDHFTSDRPDQGDPERGMDALVDLVKGEGRMEKVAEKDKEWWPLWLFLGEDAMDEVRTRNERVLKVLDGWKALGSDVGFTSK